MLIPEDLVTRGKVDALAEQLRRIAYDGGPSIDGLGHSESVKAASVNDSRMQTDHRTLAGRRVRKRSFLRRVTYWWVGVSGK